MFHYLFKNKMFYSLDTFFRATGLSSACVIWIGQPPAAHSGTADGRPVYLRENFYLSGYFAHGFTLYQSKYVERLRSLETTLSTSNFFAAHEVKALHQNRSCSLK